MKNNDIFCLNIMIDSNDKNLHSAIMDDFNKLLMTHYILNKKIIITFNSGGTVLGLFNTFKYFENTDKTNYISFFEEDFYPINKNWFIDSIDLLNTGKYIYIGEHISERTPSINNNNLVKEKNIIDMDTSNIWNLSFSKILKEHGCKLFNNLLCWTDGGYYFSTIDNFSKIFEKIGNFHKGNREIKYHHEIDGIILGEVGFPSQIKNYFNFTSLMRNKYFIHKNT